MSTLIVKTIMRFVVITVLTSNVSQLPCKNSLARVSNNGGDTKNPYSEVSRRLQASSYCELPCWWDIIPSASTITQTSQLLLAINPDAPDLVGFSILNDSPLNEVTDSQLLGTVISSADHSEYFGIDVLHRHGVAQMVAINGEGYHAYRTKGFWDTWKHYSPVEVITHYGQPTRYLLYADVQSILGLESQRKFPYSLWLMYDQLGFAVQYNGIGQYAGRNAFRMCPSIRLGGDLLTSISIYVQAKDSSIKLDDAIGPRFGIRDGFRNLPNVSGLPDSDVFQRLAHANVGACFFIPRTSWD